MKRLSMWIILGQTFLLFGQRNPYILSDLRACYEERICEQQAPLVSFGPIAPFPDPPAYPVDPPTPPTPPTPVSGFLPMIITNNTGHTAFVFVEIGSSQYLTFDGMEHGTIQTAAASQANINTGSASIQIDNSTSVTIYIPDPSNSGILVVSLDTAVTLPTDGSGKITNPSPTDSSLTPYSQFWDMGVEFSYDTSVGTKVDVDVSAAAQFAIPQYVYMNNVDAGLTNNTGLYQSKSYIFNYVHQVFDWAAANFGASGLQWANLFIPTYSSTPSSIYRLIETGKAMTAATPLFDTNYLSNGAAYGYDYLTHVLNYYTSHTLTMTIPPTGIQVQGEVFQGNVSNGIFQFNGSYGSQVTFAPFGSSTTVLIYENPQYLTTGGSSPNYVQTQVGKAFGEAVIAGLLPTTLSLDFSTLTSLPASLPGGRSAYYQINTNLSQLGQHTGPWYDVYSKALHALATAASPGALYTYTFDEPLWDNVNLTSSVDPFTNGTFISVTLGPMN